MKVGDLVRCIWQPSTAGVDKKTQCCIPMKYAIKGEIGFIVNQQHHYHMILFPKFEYVHSLSARAFEVLSESR